MNTRPLFDIAVVGAGPAGLATGLACAELGLNVAVAGPVGDPRDGRTAALFQGSVTFLKRIGTWSQIEPFAVPLDAIRLVDASGALIRAPEVTFRAHEIGLEAFGYNVPNSALTAALETASTGRLTRILTPAVSAIEINATRARLTMASSEAIDATLLAAADGRASIGRIAAGITTTEWSYPQSALVCSFVHSRPHNGISTEFHRRTGPLTLVPGPTHQTAHGAEHTSSLVFVEAPAEAQRLAALDDADFLKELSSHLGGVAGTLSQVTPRRCYPLSGQTATVLGQNRVALIGEAGHVLPPIGAQGLNLSFRDAATLAELAANTKLANTDIGAPDVLAAYNRARQPDVTARAWTIDLLNRSLLSGLMPVHLARGFGLFALSTIGPLRRLVMREGVAPAISTPRLMQPESDASALDAPTVRQA